MTRAQLLAYIDQVFTTNGVGNITGANSNAVFDEIVNSIFDILDALPTRYEVDNKSIQFDGNNKLSVKVAALGQYVSNGPVPDAFVLNYTIPNSGYSRGMFVKCDAKTITMNSQGALCVITGGGGLPDNVAIFNDFVGSFGDVESALAYPSITGANGYVKLDTGVTPAQAFMLDKRYLSTAGAPGFNIKASMNDFIESVVVIGLATNLKAPEVGTIGFWWFFDNTSVDTFWHCVVGDGDDLYDYVTGVEKDELEHEFGASYNLDDHIVRFYLDGVEIHATELEISSDSLRLGVMTQSVTGNHTIVVMDYIMASQTKATETPVFDTVAVIEEYNVKRFVVLLSQSGTNAPTYDNIFKHEFGIPALQYSNVGVYRLYLTDGFLDAQTMPLYKKWVDSSGNIIELSWIDNSNMELTTKTSGGTLTNGILNKTQVDIDVYSIITYP